MPKTPRTTPINLHDVSLRAQDAQHSITVICQATPAFSGRCQKIRASLADIPPMAGEIVCLRRAAASCRLDCANLAAAIRAAIAAQASGEDDPFSYLRDELGAQGYGDPMGAA